LNGSQEVLLLLKEDLGLTAASDVAKEDDDTAFEGTAL
jgi:hypothetical protein